MNFGKRALRSVIRKKGKSLILFAVIFVLGNVIAGSIAIQQSTQNVEKHIKKQLGATATVDFDYENHQKEMQDPDFFKDLKYLDEATIKKIGTSSYVKYYDYSINFYVTSEKVKAIETEGFNGSNMLTIKGVNYAPILDSQKKKIRLVKGTAFQQEDIDNGNAVAVISAQFADENGLSIGDQLVLDNTDYESFNEKGGVNPQFTVDTPVKVIGIFEPTSVTTKKQTAEDQANQQAFFDNQQLNTIYLPNNVVNEMATEFTEKQKKFMSAEEAAMLEDVSEGDMYVPYYVLKSPDDVEAFKQEIKPLVPKYYTVKASSDQYDQIASSMKKLAKIASYVVWIAIIATLFIISLIVLLFMRDRKHELGIYLSIGERRNRVMGQIILELLLISGCALLLSLLTGNMLGKVVSESLLKSDLLTTNSDIYGTNAFMNPDLSNINLTNQDVVNAYQVHFSAGYSLTYLAVGLATVLLSALLPLVYILRLNPKKIMM